ncbi:MAG TPA: class I SAM-dependent methyltransferase [Candidatus Dormibacteraeota bacterium]|nr:class I SAM-dependent methyltransferase [Candidatus Dormibacteraeota bacterium]
MTFDSITDKVSRYYTDRVREHGTTARGVDWNSEESQILRFEQLARVLPDGERYTLVDYGCGYGALIPFLERRTRRFAYQGFDVAEEMVTRARHDHPGGQRRFTSREADLEPADYALASGIFNVRLDTPAEDWTRYVMHTLESLNRLGTRGFSFNMLTSYSDADRMRADLYYGDPCVYFDHCKRSFSRQVALLHDYGLWEFTILVRK